MVLAGWQHNSKSVVKTPPKRKPLKFCGSRLEIMFDKAEQRSEELQKSYELLDTWKRRGDDLLYSMIPKTVADRLRQGSSPLSTCEVPYKQYKSNYLLTDEQQKLRTMDVCVCIVVYFLSKILANRTEFEFIFY